MAYGKVIVWGGLPHDGYDDKWYGDVNILWTFWQSVEKE
jgi:hypothetical protein